MLLHFGAVDYEARVWINGKFAGAHRGGQTPFGLDVTDLLNTGENSIVVRAEDQPEDRYMPRGKQYWEPKSKRIWYTRTTGIWQPVWLEAAGSSYLEKVNITPSNDGTVRFDARIARFDPSPGVSRVGARRRPHRGGGDGQCRRRARHGRRPGARQQTVVAGKSRIFTT